MLLRRGENPSARARRRAREGRRAQRQDPAAGHADRAVLRPHARWSSTRSARCTTTCCSARCWSSAVVWLFLRSLRGSLIVASVIPLALLDRVHRPALDRPAGEPDLDGRDRLRHPGRRRRGAGRERDARGAAHRKPQRRRELLGVDHPLGARRGAADVLRDGDHHRRADPGVHARARRGPHLPAARADLHASRCSARWCSRSRSCRRCARSCCGRRTREVREPKLLVERLRDGYARAARVAARARPRWSRRGVAVLLAVDGARRDAARQRVPARARRGRHRDLRRDAAQHLARRGRRTILQRRAPAPARVPRGASRR